MACGQWHADEAKNGVWMPLENWDDVSHGQSGDKISNLDAIVKNGYLAIPGYIGLIELMGYWPDAIASITTSLVMLGIL